MIPIINIPQLNLLSSIPQRPIFIFNKDKDKEKPKSRIGTVLEKLWVKILLEVLFTVVLYIAYYVVKYLLPKKYRMNNNKIREFLDHFGVITDNLPDDEDGVTNILAKSKNIVDWFQDQSSGDEPEIPETTMLSEFLTDEELKDKFEIRSNYVFAHMIFPMLKQKIKFTKKIGITKNEEKIVLKHVLDLDDKEVEIIVLTENNEFAMKVAKNSKHDYPETEVFAITTGVSFSDLAKLIFNELGNLVYIKKDENKNNGFILSKITNDDEEFYIVPKDKLEYLSTEIIKTKELGLQRSYLFNGEPGTGKTKFCTKLIQSFGAKAVKIDPGVLQFLTGDSMKEFIQYMGADFIMFDDIDRVDNSSDSTFLFCLESLKFFPNKPTLLATSNNIYELSSAVLRPGRFEDVLQFEPPTLEERQEFFQEFLKKEGIRIKIKDLKELAELTEGMTQAYLAEYALQVKLNQDNIPLVVKKIERRKKLIQDRYKDD